MKLTTFEEFWEQYKPNLMDLVKCIQNEIGDEYRAFETDDTPGIQLTISVNDDCTEWSYQTGDNSYTGSCYHHPYWGVTGIYKDSDPEDTATSLIDDLASCINFEFVE